MEKAIAQAKKKRVKDLFIPLFSLFGNSARIADNVMLRGSSVFYKRLWEHPLVDVSDPAPGHHFFNVAGRLI